MSKLLKVKSGVRHYEITAEDILASAVRLVIEYGEPGEVIVSGQFFQRIQREFGGRENFSLHVVHVLGFELPLRVDPEQSFPVKVTLKHSADLDACAIKELWSE